MIEILLAVVAGILTIAAPCILLPLPIIFGASVGQSARSRPIFITLGFVATFAVLGLTLNILVQRSGLDPQTLRHGAAILLFIFGFFMIWQALFERLTAKLSSLMNKVGQAAQQTGSGSGGGFLLGVIIGIIWTPCAGPILASILTLIAQQTDITRAALLLFAYAIGAGIPMLVIAYGGQALTTKVKTIARYSATLQRIFGIIIMIVAVAVYFQYDTVLQAKILDYFERNNLMIPMIGPTSSINQTTALKRSNPLHNYGTAPELTGINHWLNSEPLQLADLRGKVVIVDFWTYSCINCVRTLPHITALYEKYKDRGLVIIGVHTPEFAFEHETDNVARAIKQFNITYPVAQDNEYTTWRAYRNRYWPAKYVIDQDGTIVYTHFGEGAYEETENVVRKLLDLDQLVVSDQVTGFRGVGSPEMYFGLERLANLSAEQTPTEAPTTYQLPATLQLNEFVLEGDWRFTAESVELVSHTGTIRLRFSAAKVFMVTRADPEAELAITVDGQTQPVVTVTDSTLYTLFNSSTSRDQILEIKVTGQNFSAFTFTFG